MTDNIKDIMKIDMRNVSFFFIVKHWVFKCISPMQPSGGVVYCDSEDSKIGTFLFYSIAPYPFF